MDWDDIRVFVEVVEAGSLTSAARLTGLSQPTISRRLKLLEDAVGGSLFERFPNRIELTPLGKELMAPALAMKTGAKSLARQAETAARERLLAVRVSTTMSIAQFLGRHLAELSRLAAMHGGELHIEPTREPLNLAFRQADLAVRLRRIPENGPAKVKRIGRVSCAVYGHRDIAERPPGVIGLTYNRPPPQPGWLDRYAEKRQLPVVARLGEFFQRHAAIREAVGISLLSCFLGDADTDLVRMDDVPRELDEDAFLLFHPDMADFPAVRAVAEGIAALFDRFGPQLCGDGHTVQPPA